MKTAFVVQHEILIILLIAGSHTFYVANCTCNEGYFKVQDPVDPDLFECAAYDKSTAVRRADNSDSFHCSPDPFTGKAR